MNVCKSQCQICSEKTIKRFLDRTDSSSTALFNHCNKVALKNPVKVKVKQFSSFMPDICKTNSGVQRCTGHSLRATAITALSDAGFTDRNIIYMSNHKRDTSLQIYCRRPSTNQEERISNVLGQIATGMTVNSPQTSTMPTQKDSVLSSVISARPSNHVNSFVNSSDHDKENAVVPVNPSLPIMPMVGYQTHNQQINEMSKMHGFATNSMFQNCSFHFQ